MSTHYPLKFTLDDGIHVTVNPAGDDTYNFSLSGGGRDQTFTFVDDDRPKDIKSRNLDFDQLNAVRAFWLKQNHVV